MQIFDDHDDGSRDCKPSEHADDELTEAITRQRFSGPKFRQRRMSLELWNEGSEHATNPTEHRCERLAIEIFHELSDDLTNGANGQLSSPWSMHRPETNRKPCSAAHAVNSLSRRVFPTPASPATRVTEVRPSAADSSAASNRLSSSQRPTTAG